MAPAPTCETCRFYLPDSVLTGGQPGVGSCRRGPPQQSYLPTAQGPLQCCNFPQTKHDGWCGEHQVKVIV